MDLFPIGDIANSSNTGSIDGVSYSLFEPNAESFSQPVYNNLITLFQTQARLTRKKAEPYLNITYGYENIFDREYRQIEHFVDYKEDALTSFYTVDWSRPEKVRGDTPTPDGPDWIVNIDNTRVYSTTTNKKANFAMLRNHDAWKIGQVTDVSSSSITLTLLYGNLSITSAQFFSLVYPVYCVYFTPAALSDFQPTQYVRIAGGNDEDGGWMRSGKISFISKYPAT